MIKWLKNLLSIRNTDIQKQKDIEDKIIPSESEKAHKLLQDISKQKILQDYKDLLHNKKPIDNEDLAFMFAHTTDVVYKWVGENQLRFKFHERGEEHIRNSKSLKNQPHSRVKDYFEIFGDGWRWSDDFNLSYVKNETKNESWYYNTFRSEEKYSVSLSMKNIKEISKEKSFNGKECESIKLFIDNMSKNKKKKMLKIIHKVVKSVDFYSVRQYFRFISWVLNAEMKRWDSNKKTKRTFWRHYELDDVLKYYTPVQVRQNKIKHILKN